MKGSQLKINSSIWLNPLSLHDATALYRAVEHSRENLSLTMPWADDVFDTSSAEQYIEARIHSELPGSEWFAIVVEGRFSGVIGVKSIHPKRKTCELGYWLCDSARGKRVIGQALPILVDYLTKERAVKRVEFQCLEDNLASIKIVERLGARLQRKIPNHLGIQEDKLVAVYALDIPELKTPY